MSRCRWVVLVVLLATAMVPSIPAWAGDIAVEYQLEAEVDPVAASLVGRGRLRWWNRTPNVASSLQLGLRAASLSTLAVDGGAATWTSRPMTEDGADAVTTVHLPEPVLPGSSVTLDLEWQAPLTPLGVALEAHQGMLTAGAWYPQLLEVRDPLTAAAAEPWQTGPAYGHIARYRVVVTLPVGWEVASTGVEIRREGVSTGRERVLLTADGVRDFTWCTAPRDRLVVLDEEFDPLRDVPRDWLLRALEVLEVGPAELEQASVHLRVVASGDDRASAIRALSAARTGLAWVGLWLGSYRHPQLTVVVVPPGASTADLVDGPMLLGVPPVGGVRIPPPLSWPIVEAMAVRGLAGQLLEGLATPVAAGRDVIDLGLAGHAELSWVATAGGGPLRRSELLWARERLARVLPSWPWRLDRRPDGRSTGPAFDEVRAGLAMRTLEGLIGERVFARTVRRYVMQGRGDGGGGADLYTVAAESSAIDLGDFFHQVILQPGSVDWSIERVESVDPRPTADGGSPGDHQAEVHLARRGARPGPVLVRLRWADGREERRTWESDESRVQWRIVASAALTEVTLDPDGVWVLETGRGDNYWRAEPSGLAGRVRWWIACSTQVLRLGDLPWG